MEISTNTNNYIIIDDIRGYARMYGYISDKIVLQEGLVVIKNFLSVEQQKDIATTCLELGAKEIGGFYTPKPSKDADTHLRLQIMCLGYHWNAEERKYQTTREDNDKSVPQPLPPPYFEYCKMALDACKSVDPSIPNIVPTMVICNLYSESGALGWHKDDDEDEDTIKEGLPVVSLSLGNSCKFLYKDHQRQIREIVLESGDALVFGGKSRLVAHTVSDIIPFTSPIPSLPNLRLNLTFREHTKNH